MFSCVPERDVIGETGKETALEYTEKKPTEQKSEIIARRCHTDRSCTPEKSDQRDPLRWLPATEKDARGDAEEHYSKKKDR